MLKILKERLIRRCSNDSKVKMKTSCCFIALKDRTSYQLIYECLSQYMMR